MGRVLQADTATKLAANGATTYSMHLLTFAASQEGWALGVGFRVPSFQRRRAFAPARGTPSTPGGGHEETCKDVSVGWDCGEPRRLHGIANEQRRIATTTSPVTVEGYYPSTASVQIQLYQLNATNGHWDTIPGAVFVPSSTATTDAVGVPWYFFSGSVQRLQGSQYWTTSSCSSYLVTRIKAESGTSLTLTTFEGGSQTANTEACWTAINRWVELPSRRTARRPSLR
jgi:hypothetical protein